MRGGRCARDSPGQPRVARVPPPPHPTPAVLLPVVLASPRWVWGRGRPGQQRRGCAGTQGLPVCICVFPAALLLTSRPVVWGHRESPPPWRRTRTHCSSRTWGHSRGPLLCTLVRGALAGTAPSGLLLLGPQGEQRAWGAQEVAAFFPGSFLAEPPPQLGGCSCPGRALWAGPASCQPRGGGGRPAPGVTGISYSPFSAFLPLLPARPRADGEGQKVGTRPFLQLHVVTCAPRPPTPGPGGPCCGSCWWCWRWSR